MSSIVCSVDWPGLLDPVSGLGIPVLGRHIALAAHKGLYKGDKLEQVWGELLADKGCARSVISHQDH